MWTKLLAAAVLTAIATQASAQGAVERGRYLVTVMDCAGCHTTGALRGQPDAGKQLAGDAIGWLVPGLGVFYPANITPDRETGIGTWSAADIVAALREGRTPEGRILAPVMPWRAYAHLTDSDMRAVAAYLKTVPAVSNAVPGPAAPTDIQTPFITVALPGANKP